MISLQRFLSFLKKSSEDIWALWSCSWIHQRMCHISEAGKAKYTLETILNEWEVFTLNFEGEVWQFSLGQLFFWGWEKDWGAVSLVLVFGIPPRGRLSPGRAAGHGGGALDWSLMLEGIVHVQRGNPLGQGYEHFARPKKREFLLHSHQGSAGQEWAATNADTILQTKGSSGEKNIIFSFHMFHFYELTCSADMENKINIKLRLNDESE